MSFLLDNLNVIVTIGSAVGVYWMLKKAIKKDIDELKKEINEMRTVVASIDVRLSRLEGEFAERGRWESRGFIGKQQ
jgi:prefoldin subunit 5